ncbi:SIS domain-containing protein [Actinokineospora xionganensis]|uniref:SIS domain-containing protein n=1 Tax=Actinokineospora xionganensis TaxID=2684470 RepID=A0ABR7LDC5_9PSEU|nr:SIS domain-containing protein [Actinokineospora xionganensis]MBC6450701.1 SIS domain-containing protein [Actinokineospora xionganensis]
MSFITSEIASQPECWSRAVALAAELARVLPQSGERVAVVGCGTSRFIAESYAALREQRGHGRTDAFAASEFPEARTYDTVIALTRSGATSEVVDLLRALPPRTRTVAVTADPDSPVSRFADDVVPLGFADERAVVQTRFATTTLALLRAGLGEDLGPAITDLREAITVPLPADIVHAAQFTFLGRGWTVGLAHEAALKLREESAAWSESYPAMEYRHGPISVTELGRVVWMIGDLPAGLGDEITAAGGTLVTSNLDPMADLVLTQRLASAIAEAHGLDPDHPRNLTRSVILSQPA